jgi:DNA-binding PadR family transcriptional regulator
MGRSPWDSPWDQPRSWHGHRSGASWAAGGPPPWVQGLLGLAGAAKTGAPKVRRGDVRAAILDVLAVEPMNGYQIIQQIAERSGGAWKPSPGSVYPTIAQLQDEGLVEDAPTGRKAVRLTDEGRAYVEEHPDELAAVWAPFVEEPDDDEAVNFKQVIGQTVGAIVQVATTGTPDQRQKAIEILGDTRRRLYGLLAEGPDASEYDDPAEDTSEEE